MRAKELYQRVIANAGEDSINIPDAYFELSTILETETSITSKESALTNLILAADRGHPAAQHRLAVAYMTGFFAGGLVPLDPTKYS